MKLLTALLACAAIWLFVESFSKSGDFEAIKPMPEEPSVINRQLKTPTPEPPQDLRFAR